MLAMLLVGLMMLVPLTAHGQQHKPGSVAADIGMAVPAGEFSRAGARTGFAAGLNASVQVLGPAGVYASVDRASFAIASTAATTAARRWTDTGLGAGVRFSTQDGWHERVMPWVQVGLGFRFTDPPLGEAAFADLDTDGFIAVEGGAGFDLAVIPQRLHVRPTARYRRYAFEVETPGQTLRTTVQYVSLAVGLVVPLGSRQESP